MGKGGRKKGSHPLPKVGTKTELKHESQREEASVMRNFGVGHKSGERGRRGPQQPAWIKWVAMFVVVALVAAGVAALALVWI